MQKGFELSTVTKGIKMVTDQKVPQSVYVAENEVYGTHEYNIPNILGMEEFSHLEPVVPTTVNETNNDQRVYESESPKTFLELDNMIGHGISFYDESAMHIKAEKDTESVTYNCPIQSFDTYTMYPVQGHIGIKQETTFEPVEDLVIRQVKEDIDNTCNILRISPDPIQWTMEDVRKWFVWHSQQFSVPSSVYENFLMTGDQLCMLTDEDFKDRSPDAGSNFYGQLDVWKNACKFKPECPPSPPQQHLPYFDHSHVYYDTSYDLSYAPASTSPTPSEDSIDSSSSSSNISYITACHDDEYCSYTNSSLTSPIENDHKQTIHLWQFLKDLLLRPELYNSCIKWIDRHRGIFKIEDSSKVAKLWGLRKNRPAMNYDKLSRSIRQYYKKGIIKKTEHSKRLVYQFCQPYL